MTGQVTGQQAMITAIDVTVSTANGALRNVIKTPGQPALLRPSPPHRPKYYSLHRPTGGVPLLTAAAATAVAITVAAQQRALSGGRQIHGDCL